MAEVQGRGTGALNIERIYKHNPPAGGARPDAGGPLPRAGVRGTDLPHQLEPHGDAGPQRKPVAPTAGDQEVWQVIDKTVSATEL
jgi:hypothetical protein